VQVQQHVLRPLRKGRDINDILSYRQDYSSDLPKDLIASSR